MLVDDATCTVDGRLASITKQMGLFGEAEMSLPTLKLASTTPAPQLEKLMWEKELLGLFVSAHPLSEFRSALNYEKTMPIKNIPPRSTDQLKVGGLVTTVKKIMTKITD